MHFTTIASFAIAMGLVSAQSSRAPTAEKPTKPAQRGDGSFGSACWRNNDCTFAPLGARASCSANYTCSYVCLGANNAGQALLVPDFATQTCALNPDLKTQCSVETTTHDCGTESKGPSHSVPLCQYGQCTWRCADGFYKKAGKCYPAESSCKAKDGSVKQCFNIVSPGSSTCSPTGDCVYRCPVTLGYKLFTNEAQDSFRCLNLGTDAQNCGAPNTVCPPGYNGIGEPACVAGVCSVNCGKDGQIVTKNGQTYCLRQ